MGAFVPCATNPPPTGQTLMVRSGSTVLFAAYSKFTGWTWVIPGGHEERIAEPTEWWSADATAPGEPPMSFEAHALRRSKALKQLSFVFRPDSPALSKTS
jgi:hypothetical protein